jgi:Tol biopolymer transport system component
MLIVGHSALQRGPRPMVASTRRGHARKVVLALGVSALALVLIVPAASAVTPKTKLVSQRGGTQADKDSHTGDISSSGQFVTFSTDADNLDPGDTNGFRDVYVRNMKNGATRIVSLSSKGVRTNADSFRPVISANGRYIAFDSDADFLIDGKKIAGRQTYLRDRKTGKTKLISQNNAGQVANNQSVSPSISANGRLVAFQSFGSNLTGKPTAGQAQIYLRDHIARKTYLISKTKAGKPGDGGSNQSAISPDGRRIAYSSLANNLSKIDDNGWPQVYLYNRDTKKTSLVSKDAAGKAGKNGASNSPVLSAKAKSIFFDSAAKLTPHDGNGSGDVFRRTNGKISIVSRNWKGRQPSGGSWGPDVTPNGRYLTFYSYAGNVIKAGTNGTDPHVYVRDLKTGKVVLVSKTKAKGNDDSLHPRISASSKYVIFESKATNLIPGGDDNGPKSDVLRRGPLR